MDKDILKCMMEGSTKVVGTKVACMAKENLHGVMASLMKETTTWTQKKDKAFLPGKMVSNTLVNGKTINATAEE